MFMQLSVTVFGLTPDQAILVAKAAKDVDQSPPVLSEAPAAKPVRGATKPAAEAKPARGRPAKAAKVEDDDFLEGEEGAFDEDEPEDEPEADEDLGSFDEEDEDEAEEAEEQPRRRGRPAKVAPAAKGPTADSVKAAFRAYVEENPKDGRAKVAELLKKYKAKTVSEIPHDKFAEVLRRISKL